MYFPRSAVAHILGLCSSTLQQTLRHKSGDDFRPSDEGESSYCVVRADLLQLHDCFQFVAAVASILYHKNFPIYKTTCEGDINHRPKTANAVLGLSYYVLNFGVAFTTFIMRPS